MADGCKEILKRQTCRHCLCFWLCHRYTKRAGFDVHLVLTVFCECLEKLGRPMVLYVCEKVI